MSMNINSKTSIIILKIINSPEVITRTPLAILKAWRSCRGTAGMRSTDMRMIMVTIAWASSQQHLANKNLMINTIKNNQIGKEHIKVASCKTVKCLGKVHNQML
jgi:hypothetical protein